MNEMVKCNAVGCGDASCIHRGIHKYNPDHCDGTCPLHRDANCVEVIVIEEKTIPHNKSCEFHGQNIEIEVLDAWVYPKSKIIELRCIDVCKQCGEGYGSVYAIFADKFVKEV